MKKLFLLLIPFILISSTAFACDSKSCETAYISSTKQYIANYNRHAISDRTVREIYAKNRERRDYAVVSHLQRMHKFFGWRVR